LITNTLDYLRRNAIAVAALICAMLALAAGGYAAVNLPKGSVGTAQLRNRAVTPPKLDHSLIGGYVRAWASTNLLADVVGSSGPVKVKESGDLLTFTWRGKFPRRRGSCAPLVTPTAVGTGASGANAALGATWYGGRSVNVFLDPTNVEKAVSVALVC
jgi:hypothetical protein